MKFAVFQGRLTGDRDNQNIPEDAEKLFFTYEYSLVLPRTMTIKNLIMGLQAEENVISVVESSGI